MATKRMTRLELFVKNQGYTMEDTEFVDFAIGGLSSRGDPMEVIEVDFEPFTCAICGKLIDDSFPNNPEPVTTGKCCAYCNRTVVIPARWKERE